MVNAYRPTYTTFLAEVQDICENNNSEFVGNIALFMQRAQDALQADLNLEILDTYAYGTIDITGQLVRSADWRVVKSIQKVSSINPALTEPEGDYLVERHIDYINTYRRGPTASPRYWAENGTDAITVGPKPTGTQPVRLTVTQRLQALDGTNTENWLTKNVGDLYLLLILANAQTYLVNPERVQEHLAAYKMLLPQALAELRDSEARRYDPVRTAPHPAPPMGGTG